MSFTSYITNHKKKILKWILIGLIGWGVLYGLLVLLIALNWSHGDPFPIRRPHVQGDPVYMRGPIFKTFEYPSFPGGEEALDSFIAAYTDTSIKIPLSRFDIGVKEHLLSPVYIEVYVTVDEWGNTDYYKYTVPDNKTLAMDLYDENIRDIIRAMPKWSPAYRVDTITGVRTPIEYVGLIRVKYELDTNK